MTSLAAKCRTTPAAAANVVIRDDEKAAWIVAALQRLVVQIHPLAGRVPNIVGTFTDAHPFTWVEMTHPQMTTVISAINTQS